MAHRNPTNEGDSTGRHPRLLGGVVCLYMLAVMAFTASTLFAEAKPDDSLDSLEYTQSQLLEETLGVAHDELIMLIISLVVVIQVAVSFKFLRWLPQRTLVLCSFGAVALSALFTVAESIVFAEVLNYLEHLSFMVGSILMAVWCWRVFGSKKQEGS